MHDYFPLQVDSAWYRGDVAAAQKNSKMAVKFNIAAMIAGVILMVLIPVIVVTAII